MSLLDRFARVVKVRVTTLLCTFFFFPLYFPGTKHSKCSWGGKLYPQHIIIVKELLVLKKGNHGRKPSNIHLKCSSWIILDQTRNSKWAASGIKS